MAEGRSGPSGVDSHSDGDGQPRFALVRPYVAEVTEPGPNGQHRGGRVLPSWARPTESLPTVPSAGVAPVPVHVPAGPLDGRQMSGRRLRITLVAAAVVIVTGTAAGAYAAMQGNGGPVTIAAGQLPGQLLPAAVPSSPPPSIHPGVPPTTAHGTKATTATTTPSPAAPDPSPSVVFGAGPPVPAPSRSSQVAAPVNLALGRMIIATGTNGSFVAANAVDGNPDTYWEGPSSTSRRNRTQTILLDLGTATPIGRIVLRLPPQPDWPARTQTLSITGSADGWRYAAIARSAAYVFDPASGNTVTITVPATDVRYLQIEITANTGAPAGQLSEIEIFTV
jgi:hypothetical protein